MLHVFTSEADVLRLPSVLTVVCFVYINVDN